MARWAWAGRHGRPGGQVGMVRGCICTSFLARTPSDVAAGAGCQAAVKRNGRNSRHQRNVRSWMPVQVICSQSSWTGYVKVLHLFIVVMSKGSLSFCLNSSNFGTLQKLAQQRLQIRPFGCALIVWVLPEQALPLWLHFKRKTQRKSMYSGRWYQ